MKAEQIRQKLHQYIDSLDAVSLDEVNKIIGEEDAPWKYTAEDIAMFYQRRTAYLNDEGKSYTMDESISSIRKNHQPSR